MKIQPYSKILEKGSISNELELEEAFVLERKMRLMLKENPELSEIRKQLRKIIRKYEDENWNKDSEISDKKIEESDLAEIIVGRERQVLLNKSANNRF